MRYRVNAPQVSSETIEGETIIIDFISGAYFSTDKIGGVVWEKLKAGLPSGHVVAEIKRRYPGQEEAVGRAIASFIARLESEKLMVPEPGEGPSSAGGPDQALYADVFAAPVLDKYTDMQDLLLLDPIHETDEQGWPAQKKNGSQ
jgi:hypothetical protein